MNEQWFKVADVSMQWLPRSPQDRSSKCDQCGSLIPPDVLRLRVDNGQGPERKRGRGKHHSYVCRSCARDFTGEGDDQTQ